MKSEEFGMVQDGSNAPRSKVRRAIIALAWACVLLLTVWSVAALYFDFPFPKLRVSSAVAYAVILPAAAFFVRRGGWRLAIFFAGFLVVLVWWLTLKPSNDRIWQADVAQTERGE